MFPLGQNNWESKSEKMCDSTAGTGNECSERLKITVLPPVEILYGGNNSGMREIPSIIHPSCQE